MNYGYEQILEGKLVNAVEKLRQSMYYLQTNLSLAVEWIDEGNLININSLGEIQAKGSEIDTLCKEVGVLRNIIEEYRSFHRQ
jgi:hypothetical protein